EAKQIRRHLQKWLPRDGEFRLPSYDRMLAGDFSDRNYNGRKDHFCDWPWRQAVINWDGGVSTCCGSWGADEDMGSVLEQPFGKVWNGRKYRMARRSFTKPIPESEVPGNACATCPGCMV